MKVKCCVMKLVEVETEIDDKFRALAVPRPWEDEALMAEDNPIWDECTEAVEKALDIPFGDEFAPAYICSVTSAENNELMIEW